MLTHVPLFSHQNPTNILVIGGGDGGMMREVLKHPEVHTVTLVDIDSKVIDLCREYMPSLSDGAFEDPRVSVVITDGCEFVKMNKNRFDVIIVDSTDPIGPGEVLFTSEFYKDCKSTLKEGGILVCQNGVPFLQENELYQSHQRRCEHFKYSSFYVAPVPTYVGGFMAFGIASDTELLNVSDKEGLEEKIDLMEGNLKYYNAEIHKAAFALPNYIRNLIK